MFAVGASGPDPEDPLASLVVGARDPVVPGGWVRVHVERRLVGSTLGTSAELGHLLAFVESAGIIPTIGQELRMTDSATRSRSTVDDGPHGPHGPRRWAVAVPPWSGARAGVAVSA